MTVQVGKRGSQASVWNTLAPASHGGVLLSLVVLSGLAVFTLRNWLGKGLPTSFRQETLTEMAMTWLFRQELLDGHVLSEWNPYWFSGFSWLRYMSYPVYYTLALVSIVGNLSLKTVMVGYYVTVTALSGWVMFGYLRCVLKDWRPALVGAVIYQTWPYHHLVGVETWIHAAVWVCIPFILWMVERSYANGVRRRGAMLLVGIAVGSLPIVSSEFAIIAAPFLGLYLLARVLLFLRSHPQLWWRELAAWALAGLVAVGVSAFFLLPALMEVGYVGIGTKFGEGLFRFSGRVGGHSVTWGLYWYSTAIRLGLPTSTEGLPGIVGDLPALAWYPGLLAVGLAVVGGVAAVCVTRARQGSAGQRFVGWAALVGLVLALILSAGTRIPFNPFQYIPFLQNFSPFRGLLLVGVFIAILAAYGMGWLLSLRGRALARPAVGMGLTLLAVALTIGDHWPAATAYTTTQGYLSADDLKAYAWLRKNADDQSRLWDQVTAGTSAYVASTALSKVAMLRYGGYYDNGAPQHTHNQLTASAIPSVTTLRLHHTRYVLLHKADGLAEAVTRVLSKGGYRIAYENDTTAVWEDPEAEGDYVQFYRRVALDMHSDDAACLQALPALMKRNVALVAADSVAQSELTKAQLAQYDYVFADDPLTDEVVSAWVANQPQRLVTLDTVKSVATAKDSDVDAQTVRVGYARIYVNVTTRKAGLLTIAESWYPNWHVRVDGQEAQVVRANAALLGVWLEAGEHRIEFYYPRPGYVYVGFGVTLLTWLAVLCWASRHAKQALGDRGK